MLCTSTLVTRTHVGSNARARMRTHSPTLVYIILRARKKPISKDIIASTMSDRPDKAMLLEELSKLKWSDVKMMILRLPDAGVNLKDLDDIGEQHPVNERTAYATDLWLAKDRKASWIKVVRALENISKEVLAGEIECKYCCTSPCPHAESTAAAVTRPGDSASTETRDITSPALMASGLLPLSGSETEERPPFDSFSNSAGARTRKDAADMDFKFVTLLARVKSCFQEREEESDKFLRDFKAMLTTLPQSARCEHMYFLTEEKASINGAEDVDEILDILKPYWNYSDYDLLNCIITEFGTPALQKKMKIYVAELEKFEKKTTIQAYEDASMQKLEVPPHFREVTIRQGKNPAKCTLHEVHLFREEIVNRAALKKYSLRIKHTRVGSTMTILAFPPEISNDLEQVFDGQFSKENDILSVSFGPAKDQEDRRSEREIQTETTHG